MGSVLASDESRGSEWISQVRVNRVRGVSLNLELRPAKVNIIVGCNGSYKTSLLEALAVALLTSDVDADLSKYPPLLTLLSTMRMDPAWALNLSELDMDVSVDGVDVRSVGRDEILKVPSPAQSPVMTFGFKAYYNGEEFSSLRIDVTLPPGQPPAVSVTKNLAWDRVMKYFARRRPPRSYVGLGVPNPVGQDFVKAVSAVTDYARARKLLEAFNIDFLGVKYDSLGNPYLEVRLGSSTLHAQYAGGGFVTLALMALAATKDVVLFDTPEQHMHPSLLSDAVDIVAASASQWFIATQSVELVREVLRRDELVKEAQVVWLSRRPSFRVMDGERAARELFELDWDLRGPC
ncbi:hypothetical protein [Acidilobus sp.]|uniref:hypothetical protein n=1 Tax=Acidilobus sp. TaxID=1872109 RepID=UPI003D04536D